MAKEASFDVVSEINTEEVKNAIQLAEKELKNRFDFKGSTVKSILNWPSNDARFFPLIANIFIY